MRRPGLVIGLVAAVVLGGGYSFIQSEIASANLASLEPAGNSVAVANDGKTTLGHIASSGGEKGKQLPSDKIPMPCRHTHMAAEDRGFYTHPGVEWSSAARAVLGNVENGFGSEGASTITMQLAKEYAGTEKTLKRKARQVIYARRLENEWGKDKILDAFLNHNYYGRGTFGVEDASQTWFGVSAAELKDMNNSLHVARCAFLAALIKAPSFYAEYEGKPSNLTHATEVWDRVTKDVLGGMRLLKGLPSGQKMAEEKVIEDAKKLGLAGLKLTNTVKNAGNGVDGDLGLMAATREWTRGWQIEVAKQDGYKEAEAEKVGRGAADEMLARGGLKFTLSIDSKMQPLAVKSQKDHFSANASAVVVLDQRTGGVLALSGSRDYNADQNNHAIYGGRPIGSTIKPFILLDAVRQGISPKSEFTASGSIKLDGPPIKDHDGEAEPGCKMNLLDGLAVSQNVVFVEATTGKMTSCEDTTQTQPIPDYPVKYDTIEKTLKDAGVNASLVPGRDDPVTIGKQPRLAIASNETLDATPLKLAVMTMTIATGGIQRKPFLIDKIEGPNGVIFEHEEESHRVFEEKHTSIVTQGMVGVYKHPQGTARDAQVPFNAASKTGTADEAAGGDIWFTSFNATSSKYKKEPGVVCTSYEKNPKHGSVTAAKVCQQFYNGTLKQKGIPFPKADLDAGRLVGLNAKSEPPPPASKQPEPAKPSVAPASPSRKPAPQESPLPSPSPQKSGSPLQNGLTAVLPTPTVLLPSWR